MVHTRALRCRPGSPLPMSPLLRWHLPQRVDVRMVKIGCALLWPPPHHSESFMSDSCHCHKGERSKNASEKCCILLIQGSGIACPLLYSSSPGPLVTHSLASMIGLHQVPEHNEGARWPVAYRTCNLGFVSTVAHRAGGQPWRLPSHRGLP